MEINFWTAFSTVQEKIPIFRRNPAPSTSFTFSFAVMTPSDFCFFSGSLLPNKVQSPCSQLPLWEPQHRFRKKIRLGTHRLVGLQIESLKRPVGTPVMIWCTYTVESKDHTINGSNPNIVNLPLDKSHYYISSQ